MKNSICLLFLLLFSATLSAQTVSFGVEAGMVSSIHNGYSLEKIENRRNTYLTGINFTYTFSPKLSVTSGLSYLRQGYRHPTCHEFEKGVKNELTGKIDYLIIPLNMNFHLGRTNKVLATLGLYGGYNIRAVQDYPEPIGGCKVYYIPDVSSFYNDFSMGGIVGAGYRIFENDKFELTPLFRFYQGFSNTVPKREYFQWVRKYNSASLTFVLNYKIGMY